ncbi:cadmium resistance transporter [Nonomuraea sp. NPDC050783]|uniref:cadmium resistance transporter n=1 Tax=Nonomuraea sp. NPDC050783 TaxID=3154634 RepID=UPI0034651EF5
MNAGFIGQAAGLFAVTNIDDIVLLALFFAQGAGRPGAAARVVLGQYLGFTAILAVSVAAALGATLLPESVLPYLGLLPLALGIKAAWEVWRERGGGDDDDDGARSVRPGGPGTMEVAAITFANGGDNVGVYVPVFATSGPGGIAGYTAVFLVLVGVCCLAGRFFATRPPVARALGRWGDVLFPLVLIGVGVAILVEGLAF